MTIQARLSEAKPLAQRALSIHQSALGSKHPGNSVFQKNVKNIRKKMVEYKTAVKEAEVNMAELLLQES